jgi:hypothetical protein
MNIVNGAGRMRRCEDGAVMFEAAGEVTVTPLHLILRM